MKPPRIRELEEHCRHIGHAIGSTLPQGIGFALMVFDIGPGGFLTWMSSANRQDMVKLLREQADRLEAGTADTAGREA